MEFNPSNKVVKHCLQGMAMEEKGLFDEAIESFHQAWSEAKYDFEKFISAHYVARHQNNISEKLKWLEKTLGFGLKIKEALNNGLKLVSSSLKMCISKEMRTVAVSIGRFRRLIHQVSAHSLDSGRTTPPITSIIFSSPSPS